MSRKDKYSEAEETPTFIIRIDDGYCCFEYRIRDLDNRSIDSMLKLGFNDKNIISHTQLTERLR